MRNLLNRGAVACRHLWGLGLAMIVLGTLPSGALAVGPRDYGEYSSLKIDAQRNPHITCYDYNNGSLLYFYRVNGTWNVETVDDGAGEVYAGETGSLTLVNGVPNVVYLYEEYIDQPPCGGYHKNTPRLATRTGPGSWAISTVDATCTPIQGGCACIANQGQEASVAHDSGGNLHAVYLDILGGYDVYYAFIPAGGGAPVRTLIGQAIVSDYSGAAITVDPTGRPHIVYSGVYGPTYATLMSWGWWTRQVENYQTPYIALQPSIAVDSNNMAHISWGRTSGTIWYARDRIETEEPSFEVLAVDQSVTTLCGYTSIAVNSAGKARLSYMVQRNDQYGTWEDIKYAARTTTGWSKETVGTTRYTMGSRGDGLPRREQWTSLALDPVNGLPRVSYYSEKPGTVGAFTLRYAARTTSGWGTAEVVEPVSLPPPNGSGGCGSGLPRRMAADDPPPGGLAADRPETEAVPAPGRDGAPARLSAAGSVLTFELDRAGAVSIELFDVAGRRVAARRIPDAVAGTNQLNWPVDGMRTGIYFARLRSEWGLEATARWMIQR